MSDAQLALRDFLAELRELASSEVTTEWRRLAHSEIVCFEPLNTNADRSIEVVFGAEECHLSIGNLASREISLRQASEVARVTRIVAGVIINGVTVWKSRLQRFIAVGSADERAAHDHAASRTAPTLLTQWEPWVSMDLQLVLVSQFGDDETIEWL